MGRPRKNANAPSGYVAKKIQSLEGALDIVTQTDPVWDLLFKKLQRAARVYGFYPIETPLAEDWHLYENFYKNRKSEIESLITAEAGGKQAAIRPSMLPSVLRSFYQHKIFEKTPMSKWWYKGATAKKADEGRSLLDFFEYGFEVFGTFSHLTEAQLIGTVWEFLKALGINDVTLEINSIGEEQCQRAYSENLQDFLSSKKYDLCDSCNESLRTRPLDIFRCGNLDCQAIVSEAPAILDFLNPEAHKHFTNILEALDELSIPYQLNPMHVGPAGHSKTNFILKYKDKDESLILGEGGYHDGLMQNLCGKNYCCFGFSGNLKLLHYLLTSAKVEIEQQSRIEVFLVPLGELASKRSLRLFRDLTREKILVHDHFGECGVKNQLKQAEEHKAPIALILGQKEAMDELVILRDVKSGMQEVISYDKIVEEVKKRLGK
jgi:histidyl-tRNA synthetase